MQINCSISNNSLGHRQTVSSSKTFLFQAIHFNQTVLILKIQFSISIVFVKTVLFQSILFSGSTVSMSKTVLIQTIQFSIQKRFHFKQLGWAQVHSFNVKTVLNQAIQFSISTQFSSIWSIDREGPIRCYHSRPELTWKRWQWSSSLHSQSSSITGTSPSDCLVSYPGHSFGVGFTLLLRRSLCILQPNK